MPIYIPAVNPTSPIIAFRSPPAILNIILRGQPKNIKAPIITVKPSTNLVKGAEPPLTENSFPTTEIKKAPITRPIIQGRTYCTTPALCKPNAPATSLKKQAMQNPMLPGLPNLTNNTAIAPTIIPVKIIPFFSFNFCTSQNLLYTFKYNIDC